jgi:hypothetical protein
VPGPFEQLGEQFDEDEIVLDDEYVQDIAHDGDS